MQSKVHALIDIENVYVNSSDLKKLIDTTHRVYLVFALPPSYFSFEFMMDSLAYIKSDKLTLIQMDKVGKNSADFGLSFLAGRLSTELDMHDSIDIISKDAMMINIVKLLQSYGINAVQSPSIYHLIEPNIEEELQLDTNDLSYGNKDKILKKQEQVIMDQTKNVKVKATLAEQEEYLQKVNQFLIQLNLNLRSKRNALIVFKKIIQVMENNTYYLNTHKYSNIKNEKEFTNIILTNALDILTFLETIRPPTHRALKRSIVKKIGLTQQGASLIRNFLEACGLLKLNKNRKVAYTYPSYHYYINILVNLTSSNCINSSELSTDGGLSHHSIGEDIGDFIVSDDLISLSVGEDDNHLSFNGELIPHSIVEDNSHLSLDGGLVQMTDNYEQQIEELLLNSIDPSPVLIECHEDISEQ